MLELSQLLKLEFTDQDREACKPVIDRIVELCRLARKEGLMALEESVQNEELYLLKKGILLIVDGVDPEEISPILQSLILTGGYTGAELLKRLIAAEGVMVIRKSSIPRHLEDRLTAMLGEKYLAQLDAARAKEEESKKIRTVEQFLEGKKGYKVSEEHKVLNDLLCRLGNQDIQQILRNVHDGDIGFVLKICDYEASEKILKNTEETRYGEIFFHWECIVRVCDVEYAQKVILEQIHAIDGISNNGSDLPLDCDIIL